MFYSYAMGLDDSVLTLENQGFTVNRDKDNYTVSFPKEKAKTWETFILERLRTGYWNEYLTDDSVVFLFCLNEGAKRYEVRDFNNDEVLALCEKLCNQKFGSLKSMLTGNSFYKGIIEG